MVSDRNPVTGESTVIISPASTPTKQTNGFAPSNGTSTPISNGNYDHSNGNATE